MSNATSNQKQFNVTQKIPPGDSPDSHTGPENSHPLASSAPALGFDIQDGKISYSAYSLNWIMLAQALAEIDSEIITNDQARPAFDFWRYRVRAAVTASLSIESLEDKGT